MRDGGGAVKKLLVALVALAGCRSVDVHVVRSAPSPFPKEVWPSILHHSARIVYKDKAKGLGGWGSAFCVGVSDSDKLPPGKRVFILATAGHVVDREGGALSFEVEISRRDASGSQDCSVTVVEEAGSEFLVKADEHHDVAILAFVGDSDLPLSPAALSDGAVGVGDPVCASGCQAVGEAVLKCGLVALVREHSLVLDMGTCGGGSGSGVYDESGRVVGIIIGAWGHCLTNAVRANVLSEFIDDVVEKGNEG